MKIFLCDGNRRQVVASGYGSLAAALDRGLPPLGHEIIYAPERDTDVCLFVSPPSSMSPQKMPFPTAGFTMHELTTLPESKAGWVDILNRLDLLITPTEWNAQVWKDLGVRTPIAVVPLGVDPSVYHLPKTSDFTVLTVHENLGGGSSRENWRQTLQSFIQGFAGVEGARLIIKTWKWKPESFESAVCEEASRRGVDRTSIQVDVIDDVVPPNEMRALYQQCWLFLKNANREGWSLPTTEAVACGATVAATRIEPLLSHLPADTEWFDVGDNDALIAILNRSHSDYLASTSKSRRFTSSRTAALTARALERHFEKTGR